MTENATTMQEAGSEEKKFSKDDIAKRHFVMPDDAPAALEYVNKVTSVLPGNDIKSNFKPDEEFPAGYDMLVLPISKRVKDKGNEIIGACIAAVPSLPTIMNHAKGEEFLRAAAITAFSIKLGNAVRPKDDGTSSDNIPTTIEDFIENRRAGGGLEAFNTVAKDVVSALRKKGLKLMSVAILRQVLSSKAFAEAQYPKIAQDNWIKVLDLCIAQAQKQGLDTSVMENWKATRDEATVEEITEFELSLSDLGTNGEENAAA